MSVRNFVRNLVFLVVSLAVAVAFADRHDTKFKAVPGTSLEIRAVEYDGAVNGTLRVQVKNTQKTAQKFAATGLYFVPQGDPDTAPQRLGAVGPMQLATDSKKEQASIDVPAGATVDVALDVFCIDSHRGAPSTKNVFDVGGTRMPKELSHQIETGADEAVAAERKSGTSAPRPAAKGAIQSKVWESRDSDWVELDGEGKQEVAKKKKR
jgi:hypothetical protein